MPGKKCVTVRLDLINVDWAVKLQIKSNKQTITPIDSNRFSFSNIRTGIIRGVSESLGQIRYQLFRFSTGVEGWGHGLTPCLRIIFTRVVWGG